MSSLVRDTVLVAASPSRIRAMLRDPDALARVLPGCESLEVVGPEAYAAVLAVRIGFMTVRADVRAVIVEGDPSTPVSLEMTGQPRGLAGSFRVLVPFELVPEGDATRITYAIDLEVSGRLAAFGTLILRDATKRQIAELVRNVEREAAA